MSFLSTENYNTFFKKELDENWINTINVGQFVSLKPLSLFVDDYIKGNYKNVDIEFYISSLIVKIFKNYLNTLCKKRTIIKHKTFWFCDVL